MFKSFWDSQEQQAQPHPQEISTDSWYPPSVVSSTSSSRPSNSLSNVSPAEAAGIIALLKDKSLDDLRKLLSDKDAYQNLFHSLEPIKTQNRVRDELRNETLKLTRANLEKEPRIMELRNQCRIIRSTELATVQEKLYDLEREKEEILKFYSPSSFLHRLQEAMNETEEESEALHRKLLDREIDLTSFVQKYKKSHYMYHKRALTCLAAKTSVTN